jgi:two-component system, LytTR family, sensor histidine kinase AlgZ
MVSIIKQNVHPPSLPDFRNLGTILRILVAVIFGAAMFALARVNPIGAFYGEWIDAISVVAPHLLLVLTALWVGSPWLSRQTFGLGAGVVVLVALLAGVAFFAFENALVPQPPGTLLRWSLFTLFAAAALLLYFHLRVRALSPAVNEARLQALQARIRPHFLFNSINAVLSLVRSDPKRAEVALQDMADLFRVLMRDNRDLVPLADEVELCRQYLELEQLRLGRRLMVDWNMKSMPGDALVPPLLLQPLLENAVYHGIEPSSTPGTVSINLFLSRGEVHAILKNPYRANGGSHHAGNKMALANVRERLALHFDAEASLDSRVIKDAYEVHIRLPYRVVGPIAADGMVAPAARVRGSAGTQGDANSRVRLTPPEAIHG